MFTINLLFARVKQDDAKATTSAEKSTSDSERKTWKDGRYGILLTEADLSDNHEDSDYNEAEVQELESVVPSQDEG